MARGFELGGSRRPVPILYDAIEVLWVSRRRGGLGGHDRRTQQLVDRGSDLMEHTELVLQKEYGDPHIELAGKMHDTRSPTYRALFMWLYFGTAIIAAAGAIAVVVAWMA